MFYFSGVFLGILVCMFCMLIQLYIAQLHLIPFYISCQWAYMPGYKSNASQVDDDIDYLAADT